MCFSLALDVIEVLRDAGDGLYLRETVPIIPG
jgi:hypothetical protein